MSHKNDVNTNKSKTNIYKSSTELRTNFDEFWTIIRASKSPKISDYDSLKTHFEAAYLTASHLESKVATYKGKLSEMSNRLIAIENKINEDIIPALTSDKDIKAINERLCAIEKYLNNKIFPTLSSSRISEITDRLVGIELSVNEKIIPNLINAKSTSVNEEITSEPKWSEVVSRSRKRNAKTSDKPLIVCPKNPAEVISIADLQSYADPQQLDVNIVRTRTGKDNTIVIGCASPKDVEILTAKLNSNPDFTNRYEMKRPATRKPRIILRGIPKDTTDEELIEGIYRQNKEINSFMTEKEFKELMNIRFHYNGKHNSAVVIEVPQQLRRLLRNIAHIHFGWQSLVIEDHVLVTRCFNCCSLGHRASVNKIEGVIKCKLPLTCSQCTGPHKFKDCPFKDDKTKMCCPLCKTENSRSKNKIQLDTKHNALSDKCPIYRRFIQTEISRTDYGQ